MIYTNKKSIKKSVKNNYFHQFITSPLRLILLTLWCFAIWQIIQSGHDPDPYLLSRSIPLPHPYPTDFVLFLIVIIY